MNWESMEAENRSLDSYSCLQTLCHVVRSSDHRIGNLTRSIRQGDSLDGGGMFDVCGRVQSFFVYISDSYFEQQYQQCNAAMSHLF